MRDEIVTIRALCAEKRFAFKPTPGGKRFKLIDLDISQAVVNPETGRPTFSIKQSIVYLRGAKRDARR